MIATLNTDIPQEGTTIDWLTLVRDWIDSLHRDTALADRTIIAYQRDALDWVTWAERRGINGPDKVATSDIKEYRDEHHHQAGKAPATINRRLTTLALLLDHAGRKGEDNPARRVPAIQEVEREEGRALSQFEWRRLRRQAELEGSMAEALVSLLRWAGPRIGEVVPLSSGKEAPLLLGDLTINPRSGEITIRKGKGYKVRRVPLVHEAREPLRLYLHHERTERVNGWAHRNRWEEREHQWWLSSKAPLFLGERGPLTDRGVRHLLRKLSREAGLDRDISPHDLRATFITSLLDPSKYGLTNEPAPITVVARLAGHASITTTAGYAQPHTDDLRRWMGESISSA